VRIGMSINIPIQMLIKSLELLKNSLKLLNPNSNPQREILGYKIINLNLSTEGRI